MQRPVWDTVVRNEILWAGHGRYVEWLDQLEECLGQLQVKDGRSGLELDRRWTEDTAQPVCVG